MTKTIRKNKIDCSIVIPVYNSKKILPRLLARLDKTIGSSKSDFEIIFVDDCSKDKSYNVLKGLIVKYSKRKIRAIKLKKNTGQHNALLCGIRQSRGAYVSTMDDDLQQFPEDLPNLLKYIQAERMNLVYGKYKIRHHSWYRRIGSSSFDLLVRLLLGKKDQICSMRIFDRKTANRICKNKNSKVNIDAFIFAGKRNLKIGSCPIKHAERYAGKSNYNLIKLIRFELDFFLSLRVVKDSKMAQYQVSETTDSFLF